MAHASNYVPTALKREIIIDSIITIHYFEYMRDFVFHGETHDFWEFLYVDKGTVLVTAGDSDFKLTTGNIIFHKPNEFHAIRSIGKNSPNLVVVSFLSSSPSMKLFESKIDTLSITEREIISHLVGMAKQTFATPLHLPSVEQILLKPDLPFGSEQMILSDLEMLLISLMRKQSAPVIGKMPVSTSALHEHSKENRLGNILSFMEIHISRSFFADSSYMLSFSVLCSCVCSRLISPSVSSWHKQDNTLMHQ
ncbi:MAG TPA: AraC family ligand binding domain-containing protein, partial [Candidatus Blautia stercoravium]|nr:AraC family ligand binding domain-containing protein [Candidatus Blautia stercoravium]